MNIKISIVKANKNLFSIHNGIQSENVYHMFVMSEIIENMYQV